MADATWYWSDGDARNGPVKPADLARMAVAGQLRADSLVWTDGMAEWKPVGQVAGLVKYLERGAAATGAVAAATPVAVLDAPDVSQAYAPAAPLAPFRPKGNDGGLAYYTPGQGMPPRAAETLRKYATPLGDTGQWPLADAQVAEFATAAKLRRQVIGAAQAALLGFAGSILIGVIIVPIVVLASTRSPAPPAVLGFIVLFAVGLSVFYGFAWRATLKARRWAPLTLGILQSIFGALNLFSVLLNSANSSNSSADGTATLIGNAIGLLIQGAFIYVFFRGYSAIPKYLGQPAWCQELIVIAERRK